MDINSPHHYPNGEFLPNWEVSTRSGSYVVSQNYIVSKEEYKVCWGKQLS